MQLSLRKIGWTLYVTDAVVCGFLYVCLGFFPCVLLFESMAQKMTQKPEGYCITRPTVSASCLFSKAWSKAGARLLYRHKCINIFYVCGCTFLPLHCIFMGALSPKRPVLMRSARFCFFGFLPFHIDIFSEQWLHSNSLSFGTNGLPIFRRSSGFLQ